MLYNPAIQPLETDGFVETRVFSIAATGKAFRNLMDGLYSRKIEAVVREICTNAYDSHCAAGTPSRGFDIKIPSLWQPLFSVRDYGVGMPHAQVMDRYSTLFDSTKDQTNDQVGMLGLGSKSPFAYTDGFTLRCYDGEERRTYASYLGEGGVPEISLADVSPCSEPRGAEVSFPVQRDDTEAFEEALIRVLKGFPYPPVSLPEDMRRKLIPNVRSVGTGWLLTDHHYLPNYSPVYALQGCVLYPVEVDKLDTREDVSYVLKNMGAKLILDFDMGELEFTPGRETLSYTDHTLSNLRRRWQNFRRDLNEHFEEKFSTCTTDWQLAVKVDQEKLDGLFGNLFRLTEYHSRVAAVRQAMDSDTMLPHGSYQLNRIPEIDQITVVSVDPEERARRTRQMNRGATFPRGPYYCGGEVLWVEHDLSLRRPWARLRHHLSTVGSHTAIVFNPGTKRDWSKLGNPPLLRLADLPDPPPPPKAAPKPRASWDRYGVLTERGGRWDYVERDSDLLKGKAFVLVHNDWVVEPEHGTEAKTWRKLYPVTDLVRSRNLARAMRRPEPAIIRLRANEKYARWSKEPQFTLATEKWVAELSPREIAWVINYQNWHRFKKSLYSGVFSGLKKIMTQEETSWHSIRNKFYDSKLPKTPLDQLSRFAERYGRVPQKFKVSLETILNELSIQDKDHIVTLGLNQGLEVLPEPDDRTHEFPWPLLPLRWEAVARMVSDSCPSDLIHQSTRQILAEYAKGDPQ